MLIAIFQVKIVYIYIYIWPRSKQSFCITISIYVDWLFYEFFSYVGTFSKGIFIVFIGKCFQMPAHMMEKIKLNSFELCGRKVGQCLVCQERFEESK